MRGSCCGQKPSPACACAELLSTLCPATRASPLVGWVRLVSIPRMVVLPVQQMESKLSTLMRKSQGI